ncbi:Cro/CI family transcriptional regulator [Marinobacterium stanieri]|uniref:Cro/CI family transcriptional regulator n=1 Tax=Marinobacterium stanieri TaxID=49186 RepID=UPI00025588AE|nr:Cro/CI family transcriptional regulator [Marinobacterium stanieri]
MKRKTLSEFVDEVGQTEAAAALGCTQGAISKALRQKREISVLIESDGTISGQEFRQFPVSTRDGQPAA